MNTRFRDQHIPLRGFPAWWKTPIQAGVEIAVGILDCVCSKYSLMLKKYGCDFMVRRELWMGRRGDQHREGARARRRARRKNQWTSFAFNFAFSRLRGSPDGGCDMRAKLEIQALSEPGCPQPGSRDRRTGRKPGWAPHGSETYFWSRRVSLGHSAGTGLGVPRPVAPRSEADDRR